MAVSYRRDPGRRLAERLAARRPRAVRPPHPRRWANLRLRHRRAAGRERPGRRQGRHAVPPAQPVRVRRSCHRRVARGRGRPRPQVLPADRRRARRAARRRRPVGSTNVAVRSAKRAHWRHDTHEHNGDRTMKRSERLAARRYTLEREVAPHVEPEWAEAMLLELRLLGVDGARIGAALAEVDSHCVESGQSAEDAFGEPVAYARRLELPAEDDVSPRTLIRSAVPTLVQVLGMLLLLPSFAAWREDTAMEVTAGMLVSLGLLLLRLSAAVRGVVLVFRTVLRSTTSPPRTAAVRKSRSRPRLTSMPAVTSIAVSSRHAAKLGSRRSIPSTWTRVGTADRMSARGETSSSAGSSRRRA